MQKMSSTSRDFPTVRSCCICYKEDAEPFLFMPCCGTPTTTTLFCNDCLQTICHMDTRTGPNVGQCPICRKNFEFVNGALTVYTRRGVCLMCRQTYELGPEDLCERCVIGRDYPFRYLCDRCGRYQMIPHPMWKYQPTPEQKGGATWACHQGCYDYTRWTIHPEDVSSIPHVLIPESWNQVRQEQSSTMLERVRSFRSERS